MHVQRPGVTAARVQEPSTDREDRVGESPAAESMIAGPQGRLILERRRSMPVEHSWPEALDSVHRHLLGFEVANKELQKSEKRYRTIFEDAPVGMFQMSPGGQLLDLNAAMKE